MRPIAPRTGAQEVTIAEEQEEYLPITVAIYGLDGAQRGSAKLLRYTLTAEERAAVASGEDVYFMQIYPNGGPMTPVQARVGPGDWMVRGAPHE